MKKDRKLIAFDMDGTLLDGSVISNLAKNFGFTQQLIEIQKDSRLLGYERTRKIASLLEGLNEVDVIDTISKMKLIKNCRSTIAEFKAHDHVVGIISDSYTIACEYLRKKMDLDFSVANVLHSNEKHFLTGEISMPLGWERIGCNCMISVCKKFQLQNMAHRFHIALSNTVVVGDTVSDLCMIESAGKGIALMPKDEMIEERSDAVITSPDLSTVIPFVL